MRDRQRAKVYKWEDDYILNKTQLLTRTGISAVCRDICNEHGFLYPDIRYTSRHRCWYVPNKNYITLVPAIWAREIRVIIHETVHHVNYMIHGQHEWHGEYFVGEYIRLLAKYTPLPQYDLEKSAEKCGIHFTF